MTPKVPNKSDDLKIRIVMCIWFLIAAFVSASHSFVYLQQSWTRHSNWSQSIDGISLAMIALFSFTFACLYVIRVRPINKLRGIKPTVIALGGAFLLSALLALRPRMDLTPSIKLLGAGLMIGGYGFAIVSLCWLGRSFSILPEARQLVTSGPYRFVRHPVYLAEFFVLLGVLINFFSPVTCVIVVLQGLFQWRRMLNEEIILQKTFPAYEKYRRQTARLLPGIY